MYQLILSVVLEGIKAWNESQRTSFEREYHKILSKKSEAENASGEDYTDAAIDISTEEIVNLLKAYKNELTKINSAG